MVTYTSGLFPGKTFPTAAATLKAEADYMKKKKPQTGDQLYIDPQGISSSQGKRYREEEQQLYKQLGYTGGVTTTIPMDAKKEQIAQAFAQGERIPTTPAERQEFIRQQTVKTGIYGAGIRRTTPIEAGGTTRQLIGGITGYYDPQGQLAFKIKTDPTTGEQSIVDIQQKDLATPSRFEVQTPRGTVQDIILGDEGVDILETTTVDMPSLFVEEKPAARPPLVGDPIKAIQSDTYGEVFTKLFPRVMPTLRETPIVSDVISFAEKKAIEKAQSMQLYQSYQLTGTKAPLELEMKQQRMYAGRLLQVGIISAFATPKAIVSSLGPQTAIVKLEGVTQRVGAGKVKTEAAFIASKGKQSIRGLVKADTQFHRTATLVTDAGGLKTARTFKFPSAETTATVNVVKVGVKLAGGKTGLIVKPGQTYSISELAKLTRRGDMVFSKTLFDTGKVYAVKTTPPRVGAMFPTGKFVFKKGVIKATGPELFRSGAMATKYKGAFSYRGRVASLGATKSPAGDAVSFGIFKIKKGDPVIMFKDIVSSPSGANIASVIQQTTTGTTVLKAIGLQQAESAARAVTVSVLPKTFPKILSTKAISTLIPSVSAEITRTVPVSQYTGTGLYERTTDVAVYRGTTQTSMFISKQDFTQEGLLGGQRYGTTTRSDTRQKQMFATPQIVTTIQTPAVVQVPRQMPRQLQSFVQSQRYLQRQMLIQTYPTPMSFSFPFKPTFPKTPKIIFPKLPKAFKTKKEKEAFPVLVRRFGKFRVAGWGRTPMEAIGIGKEVVSTTLARTFKVPGVSPFKIPGYKTKVKKGEVKFIEPSARALGTQSELREIQSFQKKALKGGRRK